jgi:hypothetical protein
VVPEARLEETEAGHNLPLTGLDEHEAETYFPMVGMAIRGIDPFPAPQSTRYRDGLLPE